MKSLCSSLLIFVLCAAIHAQETKYYTNQLPADSLIRVDNMTLTNYFAMNFRLPEEAFESNATGIFIGDIRLNKKGELIKIFTINPLDASVDKVFNEMVYQIWNKKSLKIKDLHDTLDVVVPIQVKMSDGPFSGEHDFYYDKDLIPSFVSPMIVAVSFSSNGKTDFVEDNKLINKANENFQKKNYKKAISALDELIMRNPFNPDLFVMRAVSYYQTDKYDLACKDYKYLKYFLKSEQYRKLNPCND